MTRVAVVGGGAWGTTLADLLARSGHEVRMWAREPEVVEGINREHVNALFLPGAALARTLAATGDVDRCDPARHRPLRADRRMGAALPA